MRRLFITAGIAAVLSVPAITPSVANADETIVICHVPPGQAQTLVVGTNAAISHIEHHVGDYYNACGTGGNSGSGGT